MSKRFLTWFLPGPLEAGTSQGHVYCLEADYTDIVGLHINVGVAPVTNLELDICRNGVSIFIDRLYPTISPGATHEDLDIDDLMPYCACAEGDLITLTVRSPGSARDLSVTLDFED